MNQLPVRGLDDELAEHIRRLAKRDGTSLNQAALKLLRKGVGLADPSHGPDTVGSSLHHLITKPKPRWDVHLPGGDRAGSLERLTVRSGA